jgi:hypothetical protein
MLRRDFLLSYATAWFLLTALVDCQLDDGCEKARNSAQFVANNSCGCAVPPVCSTCASSFQTNRVTCISGCAYCDASVPSICGTMTKDVNCSRATGGDYFLSFTWKYIKGRQGTVSYGWNTENTACAVQANNRMCSSCLRPGFCCNAAPARLTTEPNIDCTNLEMGTTATTCVNNRPRLDLPVSLDESALSGILSPVAFPHLLCQQGRLVLDPNPAPISATAPTASAPTSPNLAPTTAARDCGLFRLGILCFGGCGLIRRLLGRCS